jgi:glycosyltransferase involved in cell wall biosynthesis
LLIYPKKYKGIDSIINNLNKYVDKIILVSHKMCQSVSEYKIKNFAIINNGYDSDLFYYNTKSKKIKGKVIEIVSVGNLSPIKGHDLLIKSLKYIDNVHLTLIGDGHLRKYYEQYTQQNGLEGKVTFTGFISHNKLKRYFDESDIFCLPSRSESFGISAIEAMACGLPVVATKVGEMTNIIKNSFNGYLAECHSVESLRINILQAINTKWDYFDIALWVKENYTMKKWAIDFFKLIR